MSSKHIIRVLDNFFLIKFKEGKMLSGISKGIWKLWAFGVNGEQSAL